VIEKVSQDADALRVLVVESLKKWGLVSGYENGSFDISKITSFTTDTTAVMPKMVDLLGLLWIPCAAHVLNLVTQSALKVFFPLIHAPPRVSILFYSLPLLTLEASPPVAAILEKHSKMVADVKSSNKRQFLLASLQENPLNVRSAVATRWSACLFLMCSHHTKELYTCNDRA